MDGFNHAYIYKNESLTQLTSGKWEITDIIGKFDLDKSELNLISDFKKLDSFHAQQDKSTISKDIKYIEEINKEAEPVINKLDEVYKICGSGSSWSVKDDFDDFDELWK